MPIYYKHQNCEPKNCEPKNCETKNCEPKNCETKNCEPKNCETNYKGYPIHTQNYLHQIISLYTFRSRITFFYVHPQVVYCHTLQLYKVLSVLVQTFRRSYAYQKYGQTDIHGDFCLLPKNLVCGGYNNNKVCN